MTTSRKKLIRQIHTNSDAELKLKIEKEFPKLFNESLSQMEAMSIDYEPVLEVGKWYRVGKHLMVWNEDNPTYGFNGAGAYATDLIFGEYIECTLATHEEVESALIAEATKRGFKKGVMFIPLHSGGDSYKEQHIYIGHPYLDQDLGLLANYGIHRIFTKGVWAEIVQTITKSEAEKQLGKIIV